MNIYLASSPVFKALFLGKLGCTEEPYGRRSTYLTGCPPGLTPSYDIDYEGARLTACSTGSCQKNISMDMFYTLEFGFPSVEVQTSVVSKIRMLQSQLTALESLQKQTEDNARFILDSYLPSTPVENTITYA